MKPAELVRLAVVRLGQQGVRQEEIAKEMGISQGTVSSYAKGHMTHADPKASTLLAAMSVLGLTFTDKAPEGSEPLGVTIPKAPKKAADRHAALKEENDRLKAALKQIRKSVDKL